ncbi:MAG: DUF45 domain-containing protein, partial [Candidatus Omnitrophica bacterium]|nr:DUF45 domain-containing protein [Candidatus Omnitrophota bacterium]
MGEWISTQWVLQGKNIPCAIRVHPRSKRIRLSLRPDTGLVATVAPGCTRGMLFRFVLRHQAWVLRHIERMEQTAATIPKRWPYGSTLPYQAEEHEVVLQPTSLKAQVIRQERQLIVHLRQPTIEAARRLLKRWYWTEALRLCHWHAMDWGMQLGVRWRRLRI